MGKILAVCISERKGTVKKAIACGTLLDDFGLKGDAHAGKWHRQVSLLDADAVRRFEAKYDIAVPAGAFGENLLTEGIDLKHLPVGRQLKIGTVLLEITQIGKKCHLGCNIQKQTGECIMPHEGVFAVVKRGGTVKADDTIEVINMKHSFTAAVITASDKGSQNLRRDESGPAAAKLLNEAGYTVNSITVLPDERQILADKLMELADKKINLIVTTGGTGFSPRDITPEATRDVIEREAPGITEAMRAQSMKITQRAMLSRAIAGIRGQSLIVNLPGSPKAVCECLGFILPSLEHGLAILTGRDSECARR